MESDGRPSDGVRVHRRRQPKMSVLVAREIARSIIDGELKSGDMLVPEKEMLEEYGVGRSTLREALLLLETRGVITIKSGPRGGPIFRGPRASDLSEALTLILEFEGASLRDVLHARKALEPMLARLATRNATKRNVAELQASVDHLMEHLDDNDVFLTENRRFHALIARMSGNVVLGVFSETVKSIADGARAGVSYPRNRRKAVGEAHQRIVDAVKARDEQAAEEEMSRHIDEAGRYWQRKYRDLLARPVHWAH